MVISLKSIEALSNYLIENKYIPLSIALISKKYPELNQKQIRIMLDQLETRREEEEDWLKEKLSKIEEPHLEGFIRFRYIRHLEKLVNECRVAVKELENDAFLEALRRMIPFIPKREEEVHLFLGKHGFSMQMNETDNISVTIEKWQDYYCDIALNLLIATSPEIIILHCTADMNRYFLHQIMMLLGERCVLCSGCPDCRH